MSLENYVNEIVIYLREDNWLIKLRDVKSDKVNIFRISGNGPVTHNVTKLDIVTMLDIINEATRFKCNVFKFYRVDFILFKEVTFHITLPVTHLYFERCDNVNVFIPHIFNTFKNEHNNGTTKGIGRNNKSAVRGKSRVENVWFSCCCGDSLELKKRINIELRNNYQFRRIQHAGAYRTSNDTSNKLHDRLNRDTNKLLRRNIVVRSIFQMSILTLIGLRRFDRKSLINLLPRDIVLIISRILWESREEYCHLLGNRLLGSGGSFVGNKGKFDDFDIEAIYNKNKLPTDHKELLNIEYNEWDDKCLNALKELQCKRITLNKLVIAGVTSAFASDSYNPNTIRFSFISVIFNISTDTNIRILEIRDMDFDEDTIMLEPVNGGETLNGDDSKIWELHGLEYPNLHFVEIHLIRCKNIWNFLDYFLRLMTKVIKSKVGGTTIIKRFSYGGVSLGSLESGIQRNISIFVDREKDYIQIKNLP